MKGGEDMPQEVTPRRSVATETGTAKVENRIAK